MPQLFIPVQRPDKTLIWLPGYMVERLAIKKGAQLTEAQWRDSELQALITSRQKASEHCNDQWHRKNGFYRP